MHKWHKELELFGLHLEIAVFTLHIVSKSLKIANIMNIAFLTKSYAPRRTQQLPTLNCANFAHALHSHARICQESDTSKETLNMNSSPEVSWPLQIWRKKMAEATDADMASAIGFT